MYGAASEMNLQATLAATNLPLDPCPAPHHPITCRAELLWLEEDGRMGCEHGQVPAGDARTRGAIDQSISILLIELLREKEDGDVPG
jgi:hypothetical protein